MWDCYRCDAFRCIEVTIAIEVEPRAECGALTRVVKHGHFREIISRCRREDRHERESVFMIVFNSSEAFLKPFHIFIFAEYHLCSSSESVWRERIMASRRERVGIVSCGCIAEVEEGSVWTSSIAPARLRTGGNSRPDRRLHIVCC